MVKSLRIRFYEKVSDADENGCRRWLKSFVTRGYGAFWLNGKLELAHRVAFFIEHGRWPEPLCMHSCDNRWCCAIEHLSEGTNADNMADMASKGRARSIRGTENVQSRLTDDAVRDIRTGKKSLRAYAEQYGVGHTTVWLAKSGRKWQHVLP